VSDRVSQRHAHVSDSVSQRHAHVSDRVRAVTLALVDCGHYNRGTWSIGCAGAPAGA